MTSSNSSICSDTRTWIRLNIPNGSKYALDISELLALDNAEKRRFVLGALIHDIGKLEIPWSILNKKDKLTAEEWETIKGHVTWGKNGDHERSLRRSDSVY